MTQCERIIRHLTDYGAITTMEAFADYGITRLSGRIYDLRRRGYRITSADTVGRNRYGEPVRFTTYRLEDVPTQPADDVWDTEAVDFARETEMTPMKYLNLLYKREQEKEAQNLESIR